MLQQVIVDTSILVALIDQSERSRVGVSAAVRASLR